MSITLTGYSLLSYVQHMRTHNAIPVREERVSRFVSRCRTREEMPKKFIDPAWFVLGCLVLLIWQLSVPVYAQAQTQSAPDPKGTMDRGPAAGTASAQSDLASKKVLILHSFAYAQPVYKIIDEALIKSFVASGLNFNNLYFEFLDLARNPGQNYRNELISIFRQKYQERKFDLVVALHQQSLEFLVKEGQSFYPEGPIICILGDPVPDIRAFRFKTPPHLFAFLDRYHFNGKGNIHPPTRYPEDRRHRGKRPRGPAISRFGSSRTEGHGKGIWTWSSYLPSPWMKF